MTPATSVTIVDMKARKFLGEIETPGCAQVTATANRQFFSMCADGSMLTVQFDDAGKETSKKQSKPLFDPNTDPMFDQPAVVGDKAYFISYHGMVLPVDFAGAEAVAQPAWSMLRMPNGQKWRPGGWQTVTYNAKSGLLYALMHQGGEWTHKQFGTEVWVFNAQTHQRVERIKLKTPGYSIMVSNAEKPILFDMSLLPSGWKPIPRRTANFLASTKTSAPVPVIRAIGRGAQGIDMDKFVESMTRGIAQRSSRRSFLARLGKLILGAAAIPLLPVDRVTRNANATEPKSPPRKMATMM